MKHLKLFILGVTLSFLAAILMLSNPIIGTEIVDCYDEHNNVIEELNCEEDVRKYDIRIYVIIIFTGCLLMMLAIFFSLRDT